MIAELLTCWRSPGVSITYAIRRFYKCQCLLLYYNTIILYFNRMLSITKLPCVGDVLLLIRIGG
jgi:hypothetical protein